MVKTMIEVVVKLMCSWRRGVMGNTKLRYKPSKWTWTKTTKLCKSISDSSLSVWANDLYTCISNFIYESLQWNGSALKKNCESFPMFFTF
jgi:hypothetical protein